MDSRIYWIWLQAAVGYGSPHVAALLSKFSSPEGVWNADKSEYEALNLPPSVVKSLCDKSMDYARGVLWRTISDGDWLLTPADESYPPLLRGIYSPPLVLYGRGILPALSIRPVIGMVGTRRFTQYGREVSVAFAQGLVHRGAVLVSGCATGGDEAALSAALDAGGLVVSVLPTGLDGKYPAATAYLRERILHECAGALVTEYPYGERVSRATFHVRNRLISGMSMGICVVEAPLPSGTIITANCAREQGRDVFAVPGDIRLPTSAGVNHLIQHGAKLVQCAADIMEEYAALYPDIPARHDREKTVQNATVHVAQPKAAPALPETVSDHARVIYRALTASPQPVDELAALADVPMSVAFAALTELELLGFAVAVAGQQYCRSSI